MTKIIIKTTRKEMKDEVLTKNETATKNLLPTELILSDTLKANTKKLYTAPLRPLNCSFGIVTSNDGSQQLKQLVRLQAKKQKCDVVVVFAIRRPGCANCREHGLQLTAISKLQNVAMMGIVKERGTQVIDDNLLTMYQDYFRFPMYQDEKWRTFHAMGARKMSPFKLVMGALKASRRYTRNGVENVPFGGDLFMQGGLLIFTKRGHLKYCYEEKYSEELDLAKLQAAIHAARYEYKCDDLSSNVPSNDEMTFLGNCSHTSLSCSDSVLLSSSSRTFSSCSERSQRVEM